MISELSFSTVLNAKITPIIAGGTVFVSKAIVSGAPSAKSSRWTPGRYPA